MKKRSTGSYWMVKQEPETYSWDDFVKDGETDWTGVRNYQARNNLRAMKTGDRVLFITPEKTKLWLALRKYPRLVTPTRRQMMISGWP